MSFIIISHLLYHNLKNMDVCVEVFTGLLTDRKHRLILTIDSGAIAKISLLILLQLQSIKQHIRIHYKQVLFFYKVI